MNKLLFVLIFTLILSACSPTPTDLPAAVTDLPVATDIPLQAPTSAQAGETPTAPTQEPTEAQAGTIPAAPEVQAPENWNVYANGFFGFGFAYPPDWFGPEEYVADDTLRVEIGTDVVYPYGTSPEDRIPLLYNAYFIVFQYAKASQDVSWRETYDTLAGMTDGEERSGTRDRLIRVRAVQIGRFSGFEYIATLSDTAQTEPVYSRMITLIDDQSNLLTVMGTPGNVELTGGDWRSLYQSIDAENEAQFRQIVDTLVVE